MRRKNTINPMQRTIFAALLAAPWFLPSATFAEVIKFTCSWQGSKPIKIIVDTEQRRGVRDDGGYTYTLVKATKFGVWLLVDEPHSALAAAIQVIDRMASEEDSKGGTWTDVIITSQAVSPIIAGGNCWEETQ